MSDDKVDSILTAWCLNAVSSVPYSSDAAVRSVSGRDFRLKPRAATINVANDNQRPCHVALLDLPRSGVGVLGKQRLSVEPILAQSIMRHWAFALGKQFQALFRQLCTIGLRGVGRVTGNGHMIVPNDKNECCCAVRDACQQRFEAVERRQSN